MANVSIIGQTFAFTCCKAWAELGIETTISGLYMVEDVVYPDRTCGQWEGGYYVCPAHLAGIGAGTREGPVYFVDDMIFTEQTNPKSYGRYLEQNREMDFHEEDLDKEIDDLFKLPDKTQIGAWVKRDTSTGRFCTCPWYQDDSECPVHGHP